MKEVLNKTLIEILRKKSLQEIDEAKNAIAHEWKLFVVVIETGRLRVF